MSVEIVKSESEKHVSRVGDKNRHGLEIRHTGKPIEGSVATKGGVVYLVLDCSTSMADGRKLPKAKEGTIEFAKDAFKKNYSVGLVIFDSGPRHIIEPQRSSARLQQAMETVHANGSTDMAGGIRMATENLQRLHAVKAMVIVTDGYPDYAPDALQAAAEAKECKIDIITLGTDDADHAFLKRLASRDDLSVMVSESNFKEGIASTAKMLPDPNTGKALT